MMPDEQDFDLNVVSDSCRLKAPIVLLFMAEEWLRG